MNSKNTQSENACPTIFNRLRGYFSFIKQLANKSINQPTDYNNPSQPYQLPQSEVRKGILEPMQIQKIKAELLSKYPNDFHQKYQDAYIPPNFSYMMNSQDLLEEEKIINALSLKYHILNRNKYNQEMIQRAKMIVNKENACILVKNKFLYNSNKEEYIIEFEPEVVIKDYLKRQSNLKKIANAPIEQNTIRRKRRFTEVNQTLGEDGKEVQYLKKRLKEFQSENEELRNKYEDVKKSRASYAYKDVVNTNCIKKLKSEIESLRANTKLSLSKGRELLNKENMLKTEMEKMKEENEMKIKMIVEEKEKGNKRIEELEELSRKAIEEAERRKKEIEKKEREVEEINKKMQEVKEILEKKIKEEKEEKEKIAKEIERIKQEQELKEKLEKEKEKEIIESKKEEEEEKKSSPVNVIKQNKNLFVESISESIKEQSETDKSPKEEEKKEIKEVSPFDNSKSNDLSTSTIINPDQNTSTSTVTSNSIFNFKPINTKTDTNNTTQNQTLPPQTITTEIPKPQTQQPSSTTNLFTADNPFLKCFQTNINSTSSTVAPSSGIFQVPQQPQQAIPSVFSVPNTQPVQQIQPIQTVQNPFVMQSQQISNPFSSSTTPTPSNPFATFTQQPVQSSSMISNPFTSNTTNTMMNTDNGMNIDSTMNNNIPMNGTTPDINSYINPFQNQNNVISNPINQTSSPFTQPASGFPNVFNSNSSFGFGSGNQSSDNNPFLPKKNQSQPKSLFDNSEPDRRKVHR